MVNWKSKKTGDFLWLANVILIVLLVNILAQVNFFRIDLTEENRYSIKDQTKSILQDLDDDVYIEVFLEGDLNPGFKRLRKNTAEILEEFSIYSNSKVKYSFTNPSVAAGQKARSEYMADLAAKGIQPTNVIDKKDGQRVEKIVFPGAVVSYAGAETGVMLLKGNKAVTSEEVLNQSIEGIEFELINAIYKLSNTDRKRIGFVTGHGELDSAHVAGFKSELLALYDVYKTNLDPHSDLNAFDLLIIARPLYRFTEAEKLHLDQYIMKGGKVMFLLDRINASIENASDENYLALPFDTNLEDMLFRYGVRININLLQDQNAALYPVVTGQVGGKPQLQLMEYFFYPLINRYPDHPITRNIDAIALHFTSSMDSVKASGIKKTPMLFTSPFTKVMGAPVNISVNELRKNTSAHGFDDGTQAVAYLLEGSFTSLYKNRFLPEGVSPANVLEHGKATRLLVVADGDIARNELNPRTRQPQALGFDPFTNYTFANREFLMNAVAFLVDENGLVQTRTKEVKIRPLNKEKVLNEKLKWQLINVVLPILLMSSYGVIRAYLRKRKFARFNDTGDKK